MGHGNRHDEGHGDGADDARDDEPDDEPTRPGSPLPDPLDRVWLHPTELSMFGPPPDQGSALGGMRHRGLPWLVPLLAAAGGALLAVGGLAATGSLDRSSSSGSSALPVRDTKIAASPTAADTLARLSPSVVAVYAKDAQGARRGSGVCVRHGTQLLTSTRVVGAATTVQVVTADGRKHLARVAGRDVVTDLVLLDVQDGANVPAAPLADGLPRTGSSVWLLGAAGPGTKSPWMSGGMASTNDALVVDALGPTTGGLLETDALSNSAVVGGALVDQSGTVAGVVLGHLKGSSTTYAVPISVAVGVARQLDQTGVARHGSLGVGGTDTPFGPMIVKMAKDAPAARAGAHVSDLVQAVNGRAVDSITDVMALVRSRDPGSVVVIDLLRGKQTLAVHVRLGATPG